MIEGDVIHDVCRFSYDSNGNMTGIVTDRPAADGHTERRIAERKLLWDEENRLRAVDDNGFISCYFYDHTGRRTIKLTGGGRHTYVNGSADTDSTDTRNCTIYPGPNTVFSFSDGAYRQGRLSRHIYAGNERILTAVSLRKPVLTSASGTSRRPFEAQKDTLQSLVKQIYTDCGVPFKGIDNTAPSVGPVVDAESVYFYHPDHLGSTTLLTDATGRPTQRVEYAPFGELFLDRRDGTTWHTPYLFNAKELDEETGLYYYGARYYDPHLSLWISPDPLERKYPFFSTYSYTMNNPVRFIDPDGRSGEIVYDVKTGIATVSSKLYFYGGAANPELSKKIAEGISSRWNGTGTIVDYKGKQYRIVFNIKYETISVEDAISLAKNNTKAENNFVRVEDGEDGKSSFSSTSKYYGGGNSFWFNTKDDLENGTTPAHEYGHSIGLEHPAEDLSNVTSQPNIMVPRRTPYGENWSIQLGNIKVVNPDYRIVTKQNVYDAYLENFGNNPSSTIKNFIYDKTGEKISY